MAGAGVRHGQENFGNSPIDVDHDDSEDELDEEQLEYIRENDGFADSEDD